MFVFSPFESRGIRLTALRTSTCSLLSGRLYEVMRVTAPYFSPLNTFCRKCKQIQVSNASLGLMDGFLIWGISSPVPTLSSQRTSLSADYSLKSFVSGLPVASEETKINYSSEWERKGGKTTQEEHKTITLTLHSSVCSVSRESPLPSAWKHCSKHCQGTNT